MKIWWAIHLQALMMLVFTDERIKVGLKRGKSDHHALIHAKKTRANEEGENEGEAHAVADIPIQPSFPPT